MKKTIYMLFLLTGIMITTTACSNPVKAEQLKLSEEVTMVTEENKELKEEIQQLQQKNQELDEAIAKLDPSKADTEPAIEGAVFNIYTADPNSEDYKKELKSQIKIAKEFALEEKLEILAKALSESEFSNLGIEVTKIEDQEGKKIAIINLTEDPNQGDANWQSGEIGYFDGSAGGGVTTTILQETFLQRGVSIGDWIDGVKFLYEGQAIQYDHVEQLGQVTEREQAE